MCPAQPPAIESNPYAYLVDFMRVESTLAANISHRSGCWCNPIAWGGSGDAKRKDGALDRSSGGTPGAHDLREEIRTEADKCPVQRDIAVVPLASCVARCAISDNWPVSQTQPALIALRLKTRGYEGLRLPCPHHRNRCRAIKRSFLGVGPLVVRCRECRTSDPPAKAHTTFLLGTMRSRTRPQIARRFST